MTDQLTELLERTADAWSRDVPTPALDTSRRGGRSTETTARRTRWAPFAAAAAAVLAVGVPAVLLSSSPDRPAPIAQVGEPVRVDPNERPQDTDAALPGMAMVPSGPAACSVGDVTAALELGRGQLFLNLRSDANACLLPEQQRLELPNAVMTTHRTQPAVPNPPVFQGRLLDGRGVALRAEWRGDCSRVPSTGRLTGLTGGDVVVAVSGTPADCTPGESPTLTLGPAQILGAPAGIVPADRAGISVSLALPNEVPAGGAFEYAVTLTNTTTSPIALRPCPTFRVNFTDGQMGGGGGGRLPCDDLPAALDARSEIRLLLTGKPAATGSSTGPGRLTVTWGIAGTEEATGTVEQTSAPSVTLEEVPYLEPSGKPQTGTFRYQVNGPFPVVIDGPTSAKAGEVLRYRAVLTNPPGGEPIPLRPCSAWTETFVVAPVASKNPVPSVRRGNLNCAQAPETIEPGATIAFAMELRVPATTTPGPYQLFWEIHRGVDSEPFDLTVTR